MSNLRSASRPLRNNDLHQTDTHNIDSFVFIILAIARSISNYGTLVLNIYPTINFVRG